ncbi:MAG: prolyl oligopeptidase family serine peptidase [Anaerolineae bacterium]|nr:prolyl oligopeptidase family serine peptidase [Anaerolineae bacterium]
MNPDSFLEALLTLPLLAGPDVSPDGRWVAWTWYRTGPAADVYAAPTDGSAPPLRLTDTPDDTVVASWTVDSRAVLVAQDHDGDERAQLFRVDLDRPGEMQPLTEAAPHFFLRGGQLHPNGRWLVYAANWDEEAGREIEATWVYRHDLETGRRRPLARPARAAYSVPELNHAGTHVLYARKDRHPAGRQVWLVDVEGRDDREIVNAGDDRKAWASWHPDSRRALVLAEAETYQRVGLWDVDEGSLRWLVDDPERNVESAYVPHGSRHAVLVEARGARLRASLLDVESGRETPLPDVPGSLLPLAPAGPPGRGGRQEWVAEAYSSRQPADLVRVAPDGDGAGEVASLTGIWDRTPLTPANLAGAEDFRWRGADGLEIQGWLYRPRGEDRGTVVYVHGGPTWHSEDRINTQIQYLVSRGFTVLDPNYRGSTGFSHSYREAIKVRGWGGDEQEDIRAGIEALLAAGIARPGKVGITGTSYGGYSSWWAITHFPPEIVAAAAPICGMTDLVVDYETTRPDLRPLSEEMMGGSPAQVPERYRERSPLHAVGDIRGRLLIVQGLQDPNVTPENVRVVRRALEEAGVPYELLAFEDEGHGIARPANQRVLYRRLADFFQQAFAVTG